MVPAWMLAPLLLSVTRGLLSLLLMSLLASPLPFALLAVLMPIVSGMGGNAGGLMTVRGSANLLTRTTAILAALSAVSR